MSKMRVLELFGGIGACSKALEKIGVEYKIADYVEIDKYAVQSFNAMHGTNFEPQDITKWDKDIKVDLIMHGSPCQDFSIAGLGKGGDESSGTRSSLMYETIRIVEKLKPKYVIWENVKNLLSKKHRHNFDAYIEKMEELGYESRFQIMNAKDYGVPQNRERVFTISVLGDNNFEFPEKLELSKKLKDILENDVDEKFFLSDEKAMTYVEKTGLVERSGVIGKVEGIRGHDQVKRVYGEDGVAPTLSTMQGGHREPKIAIRTANKLGYDVAHDGDGVDLSYPNSKTRRGRVGHGVAKTIATKDLQGVVVNTRIRKLTPKECWRLMGFEDSDFEKAEKVNSNTQLYKQAGNSIVVDVLEKILTNLIKEE